MPAEEPYATISLIASAYWFAYFLIILPLLGVIEKPLPQPATIEEDFNAHYGAQSASGRVRKGTTKMFRKIALTAVAALALLRWALRQRRR